MYKRNFTVRKKDFIPCVYNSIIGLKSHFSPKCKFAYFAHELSLYNIRGGLTQLRIAVGKKSTNISKGIGLFFFLSIEYSLYSALVIFQIFFEC